MVSKVTFFSPNSHSEAHRVCRLSGAASVDLRMTVWAEKI